MVHRVRIAVDILLATCFVAVMATALVEETPHEFLGLALFALAFVHIALNRHRLVAMLKGRPSVVRVLQLVLVVGLAACVIGQVASAFVLSKHALAFLPALPGSSWARRAHMLCSYWSFILAFAHAGFQAKGVLARVRRRSQPRSATKRAGCVVIAVVAAFGVVSFVQLGLPTYLTAQVQFAAGDPYVLLACVRWTSVAVLVAAVFHCLRAALEARTGKSARV